ncbi:MAG: hypothetical protein V4692_05875 [Bdellovibrionota bacterium]
MFIATTLSIALLAVITTAFAGNSVFFRSEESKTDNDGPVFNEISFFSRGSNEIWMMNQKHHGISTSPDKTDRLAIIVDTSTNPKTAHFLQLKPGSLEWSDDLLVTSKTPLKVSCFLCHSNGPRAIRPHPNDPVGITSWLTIAKWNLKIKTYGRIIPAQAHADEDPSLKIPFRYSGRYENQTLELNACSKCHQDSGFFARGKLTRLNRMTIKHMVESGHMPPPGFSMSATDRDRLSAFMN